MWSYQLEAVAHERVRTWEKEIAQRQVLAQLPPSQKPWQQEMGRSMIWMGAWLLRLANG